MDNSVIAWPEDNETQPPLCVIKETREKNKRRDCVSLEQVSEMDAKLYAHKQHMTKHTQICTHTRTQTITMICRKQIFDISK